MLCWEGPFRGLQPRIDARSKQGLYADIARNVDLSQGRLDPWRCPTLVHDAGDAKSVHVKKGKWRAWDADGISVHRSNAGYCYVSNPCDCLHRIKDWCKDMPVPVGLPRPDPVEISGGEPVDDWCNELVTVYITYLNDCWEEGAPSRPSNALKCKKDDVINISIPPPPTDKYPIDRVCVYMSHTTWDPTQGMHDPRTQQTGSILSNNFETAGDVDCFKVMEVPVGQSSVSIECGAPCGRTMRSQGWLPPPEDMCLAGETETGSLVGFTKECLMFSERNQHHAWPIRNMMSFGCDIQYACAYNLTVFVITTDCRLYLVRDDTDCRDETVKCRSVLNAGNVPPLCVDKKQARKQVICDRRGFYWVSPEGLMRVDENNPTPINTTSPFMTETQWAMACPAQARIGTYRGSIFMTMPGFSGVMDNNINGHYPQSADPTQGIPQNLTELSYCPECWIEDDCGGLYMQDCDGKIYEWNTGDECMPMTYRTTPVYSSGRHTTSAQLEYSGISRCENAGCKNNFSIYADGKLRCVSAINTPRPFRTKRVRGHDMAVGYHGTSSVRRMCLGSSFGDLISG